MSKEFYVYLAGPIGGCDYNDCTQWRDEVTAKLPNHIIAVNPMRGKEHLAGKKIKDLKEKHYLCTDDAIMSRDRNDVLNIANIVLVNFLGAKEISKGTLIEIGWADARRIPIIIAIEPENIHQHPMVRKAAHRIVDNLDDAIKYIRSYFSFAERL